ncbi:MAG: TMEM175 family protein, partial [Methanolinea sp.]|nr:TMEM175 family protein [Methanolinea sp.]
LIVKNNFPLPRNIAADDLPFLIQYIDQVTSDGIVFVFTFVIMAVFYILFFEMLRTMRTLDREFVYLSFGFLLSLIFVPLTSLLWTYSDLPVYGVLFHVNILICGLVMIVLWRHASRDERLLLPGTREGTIRNLSQRMSLFPATSLVGILLDGWALSFGEIPITILYMVPLVLFALWSAES